MATDRKTLPTATIVVEWENVIDVEDEWTATAMAALERELASLSARVTEKPKVAYLYDETRVDPAVIRRFIALAAPRLAEVSTLELVPTPGLSYYKLKNLGISQSDTEFTIVLDSDAAPQPGWYEALLKPFADPSVMVVAGFTYLAHNDLVSRAMALSWFFELPDERARTEARKELHANNFAVRTEFFRAHPFPDLPLFKRHCSFWLRDLLAEGVGFVRTAEARAVHAPHPGFRYLMWRGWQSGSDRDYQVFQEKSRNRAARVGHSFAFLGKKTVRSWRRILTLGGKVDLKPWQRPAAMLVALSYYSTAAAGEAWNAVTKSYEKRPLPNGRGAA